MNGVLRVHSGQRVLSGQTALVQWEGAHASGQGVLDNGTVLSGQRVLITGCLLDKGHLVNGRHGHMGNTEHTEGDINYNATHASKSRDYIVIRCRNFIII